jgi:uncharacterized protein YndB with AHSA1/START domain
MLRRMTEDAAGFTVERRIEAPREAVWRALTDPEELERWFGWEAPGLRDEIRFIFVDHAEPRPPGRIEMAGGQAIELEEEGGATVVRAVQAGGGDAATYDGIREGWRAFLTQLAHLLERAPGQDRRTLHLTGEGSPRAAAGALRARGGEEAGGARSSGPPSCPRPEASRRPACSRSWTPASRSTPTVPRG